jgi:hypothetical protein
LVACYVSPVEDNIDVGSVDHDGKRSNSPGGTVAARGW